MESNRPTWRDDALLAALLAVGLGVVWAWRDWTNLSALRLPDTDDVVRLQQVRDWLAGQRWGDLTQHRLGLAGVPMHWSRLADLGPAALILAFAPSLGRHGAEIAAVILWPPMLFAVALFLIARIACRLGDGLAGTAAVIAAVAYPATTLFAPGRIDHHGLQMLLLLGGVLAMLARPSARTGAMAGLLAIAGLVVGLETVPLVAVLGAAAVAWWTADAAGSTRRLWGWGGGVLTGLELARRLFANDAWTYPACDGFTSDAWRAAMAVAAVPLILAVCSARVPAGKARALLAVLVGATVVGTAAWFSPRCLSPYGGLDPVLASGWLARVGEAQPLFAAPAATAIGYAGLMAAGIVATAWRLGVERRGGWALLLALQLASAAVTLAQLRGAYPAALLAAPGLAAAIRTARERGALPLAGAWIASAGILYPLGAAALPRTTGDARPSPSAGCDVPALTAGLAYLPAGTVVGPVDLGAWGLAATSHRFLAAPYHRDGAGMLAADRFFAAPSRTAQVIAARWRIDYAVTCAAGQPSDAVRGWQRIAAGGDAAIWRHPARRDRPSSR